MNQMVRYSVKKNYARFQCPSCHEWLNTDITDAGKPDRCPCCATVFTAPGKTELLQRVEQENERARLLGQEQQARATALAAESEKVQELRAAKLLAKQERASVLPSLEQQPQPPEPRVAEPPAIVVARPAKKRFTGKRVIVAAILLALVYFNFGFFVIQPIGAIPTGATVVYFRLGLNIPFVSSADGMLVKSGDGVSLLGRGMMLAAVSSVIADRRIVSLPYSRTLYLWTTGGRDFDR